MFIWNNESCGNLPFNHMLWNNADGSSGTSQVLLLGNFIYFTINHPHFIFLQVTTRILLFLRVTTCIFIFSNTRRRGTFPWFLTDQEGEYSNFHPSPPTLCNGMALSTFLLFFMDKWLQVTLDQIFLVERGWGVEGSGIFGNFSVI